MRLKTIPNKESKRLGKAINMIRITTHQYIKTNGYFNFIVKYTTGLLPIASDTVSPQKNVPSSFEKLLPGCATTTSEIHSN